MLVLLCGAVGASVSFYLARKRRKQIERVHESIKDAAVLGKFSSDSRRAILVAHAIVRAQVCKAFLVTSSQYAPVPLTYCKAIIGNYGSIMATAVGGSLIVIAFGRVVFDRLKHRDPATAAAEDKENVLVGAVEAVSGCDVFRARLTIYSVGKSAWGQGPLRGGLSVFGASPKLDQCASKERYLAEKLAEMSHAALGGAASLVHLSQLQVSDQHISDSVGALVSYAKKSCGAADILVAPEVSEAWDTFASRLATHRKEMRGLANKIYYPAVTGWNGAAAHKALLMVNATEPVVRFARGSQDCSQVLAQLVAELGSSHVRLLKSVINAFVFGVAVGVEASSWLPPERESAP